MKQLRMRWKVRAMKQDDEIEMELTLDFEPMHILQIVIPDFDPTQHSTRRSFASIFTVGLCRKALKKKRRRRRLKKGLLIQSAGDVVDVNRTTRRISINGMEFSVHPAERFSVTSMAADEEFVELSWKLMAAGEVYGEIDV
ncbi:hypothetical protein L1987_06921 [Smallanthus sonchifolius]|uniref:Uncharacterized protein n=1 Tax=Smallanthus sonchifolius TaxID=185202 RepID=A0ACB9JZH0_9ASTR|nr:hypothetical protein L1987_06921 [Smallanthus sonchifolius]